MPLRIEGAGIGGALWRLVVAKVADYEEYQARTTRRIPVVVLERR